MKKKISTQQILAYILLLAFAAPTLLYVFNWLSESFKTDSRAATLEQYKTAPKSNFFKEGELQFLSTDGKTIKKIDIEIARTDEKRAQGLMYRQSMDEMQGMLFLMEKLEPQSFWMRNTYISLDILYVNDQKEIVSIAKMAQPQSESPIPSGVPAIYVVEVNGGFCDRHQVKVGDKISWTESAM